MTLKICSAVLYLCQARYLKCRITRQRMSENVLSTDMKKKKEMSNRNRYTRVVVGRLVTK